MPRYEDTQQGSAIDLELTPKAEGVGGVEGIIHEVSVAVIRHRQHSQVGRLHQRQH